MAEIFSSKVASTCPSVYEDLSMTGTDSRSDALCVYFGWGNERVVNKMEVKANFGQRFFFFKSPLRVQYLDTATEDNG